MLRLSGRGRLLAARGPDAERLADAGALIHRLVQALAEDLGRRGRASARLSGGGQSLLVVESGDESLAVAAGPSQRLENLATRAGLR